LGATTAGAKVFFQEKFDAGWEDRWSKSTWKKEEGTDGAFTATAGKWHGDAADLGIQTGPDARFYALSAAADAPFSNAGVPLVLQFSVKHEQGLDCGGGYIKLMPASSSMEDFSGDTPYSIMFGPDVCGSSTKRVHVIFNYKGENLLTKKYGLPIERRTLLGWFERRPVRLLIPSRRAAITRERRLEGDRCPSCAWCEC
jgi:calreticulin